MCFLQEGGASSKKAALPKSSIASANITSNRGPNDQMPQDYGVHFLFELYRNPP